jgi:hypothetical protein
MKMVWPLILLFAFVGCSSESEKESDNIQKIKKDFINSILGESLVDEGPFHMNYHLRSVLFSDDVVSFFGKTLVQAHMPHGWVRYETKTLVKENGAFKEIVLSDLFPQASQQELLRSYCEDFFKHRCNNCSYFQGAEPIRKYLELEMMKLFVVDHESLIIIFQPYEVGGFADGPFYVKIPFTELVGKWQVGNPLEKHLPITKNFLSSWEENEWISDVQDDHSIVQPTSDP